jgi:hypothetical protein
MKTNNSKTDIENTKCVDIWYDNNKIRFFKLMLDGTSQAYNEPEINLYTNT